MSVVVRARARCTARVGTLSVRLLLAQVLLPLLRFDARVGRLLGHEVHASNGCRVAEGQEEQDGARGTKDGDGDERTARDDAWLVREDERHGARAEPDNLR